MALLQRNVSSAVIAVALLAGCGSVARPAPIANARRARASAAPREVECARATVLHLPTIFFTGPLDRDAVDAWIAARGPQIEASLVERRWYYEDRDLEVHARHILVRASAEDRSAGRDRARIRAQSLLERALAGADFAALAVAHSEDPGSAPSGGDLGWNVRGRMVRPFDDAMFAGAPGVVARVIETQFGYHVLEILGRREGDVPHDEALRQEGERLADRGLRMELARETALRAIELVRSGEQSLESVGPVLLPAHRAALEGALFETELFGRGDDVGVRALDPETLIEATLAVAPGELITEPIETEVGWLVVQRTGREIRRTGHPPRCTSSPAPTGPEAEEEEIDENGEARPREQDADPFR